MSRHFNKNIKKIQPKTRGFAFKISKNPSFLPPKSYYIGLSLRKCIYIFAYPALQPKTIPTI